MFQLLTFLSYFVIIYPFNTFDGVYWKLRASLVIHI